MDTPRDSHSYPEADLPESKRRIQKGLSLRTSLIVLIVFQLSKRASRDRMHRDARHHILESMFMSLSKSHGGVMVGNEDVPKRGALTSTTYLVVLGRSGRKSLGSTQCSNNK